MTKQVGTKPYQTPRNADLGTLAYQDSDNATMAKANIDNFTGFMTTNSYTVNGVSDTPTTVFTVGNTRAVYLVTADGRDSGNNMYSTTMYILTIGAYDKELVRLGNASNHYGNGILTLTLSSGSALNVDVRVQQTSPGSADVSIRTIQLV